MDDFDLRYDVDTAGVVPKWRLLLSSVNARYGVRYQPIGEPEFVTALNFIEADFSQFSFVDLGCGKGRALVIAERYQFKNVIGVEYNKALAATARRNVRRASVVHADASEFALPDGPLVVFLYNPFSGPVMARVVDRISAHQAPIYILYKNPQCAALFNACATPSGKIPGTIDYYAWKRKNNFCKK